LSCRHSSAGGLFAVEQLSFQVSFLIANHMFSAKIDETTTSGKVVVENGYWLLHKNAS